MENQISSGLRHATQAFRAQLSDHPPGCRTVLLALCADVDWYADALDSALSSSPAPSVRPAKAASVDVASLDRPSAHAVLNAAARLSSLVGASAKHLWYRPGTLEARSLSELAAGIAARKYALIAGPIEAAFPGLRSDPGVFDAALTEVNAWTQTRADEDVDPG